MADQIHKAADAVEEWRSVLGYEGLYEVSSRGNVRPLPRSLTIPASAYRPAHRRTRQGQAMRPQVDIWGYPLVQLCRDGIRTKRKLHVLVCEAFHGPRPPLQDCLHGDGDRMNPCVENVRWGTDAENRADMVKHGTVCAGSRNASAKLSEDQVQAIRSDRTSRLIDLAAKYRVCISTISNIRTGKTWVSAQGA